MDLINIAALLASGFGTGCFVGVIFGGVSGAVIAKKTTSRAVTFRSGEPLLLFIDLYQPRDKFFSYIAIGALFVVVILFFIVVYDRYYPETLEPLNIICAGEHCWP